MPRASGPGFADRSNPGGARAGQIVQGDNPPQTPVNGIVTILSSTGD